MTEDERLRKLKEEADRVNADKKALADRQTEAATQDFVEWRTIRANVHRVLDEAKGKLERSGFTNVKVTKVDIGTSGHIGSIEAGHPSITGTTKVEVHGERAIPSDPNSRRLRYKKNGQAGPLMTEAIVVDTVTKLFP